MCAIICVCVCVCVMYRYTVECLTWSLYGEFRSIISMRSHPLPVKFSRCTPGTRFLPNITVQGRALSTDPHAMAYKSSSPVECQTLCEYHRIFQCESVDYSSANKECVLHAVRQIDGLKTVVSPSYNHYEMGCVVPVMPGEYPSTPPHPYTHTPACTHKLVTTYINKSLIFNSAPALFHRLLHRVGYFTDLLQ